jgi:hypothetical protein
VLILLVKHSEGDWEDVRQENWRDFLFLFEQMPEELKPSQKQQEAQMG